VTVVLGSQWGDEGKGKLVDVLGNEVDVCARCAGGNNAGHTIVAHGKTFAFHLLPSGLVNPECVGLIGNGVVVHIPAFFEEVEALEKQGTLLRLYLRVHALMYTQGLTVQGRLFVSDRAQLVFDFHQIVDGLKEVELGGKRYARGDYSPLSYLHICFSIGTTKKGIGPAYSGKASRSGLRVHHLFNHDAFADKFRKIVEGRFKRYGYFEYDTEGEIARYKARASLPPLHTDTDASARSSQSGSGRS
jgi:adenylosuccinate synthase